MILALSALLEPAYKRWNARLPRLTASRGFHLVRVLRTFLIVNIGWFFDRCAHGTDALRMMGTVLTNPRVSQLSLDTVSTLGIPRPDFFVLALSALLLFAVSLMQERGADVRGGVLRLWLPLRWLVFIAAIVSVLVLGVWGSGFSEASFIYYQF